VHAALADVTDAEADPDRRAWHRAQAAAGPDEDVAAELERSAGRAQARGGLAAAGAFLERAAILSVDPDLRAERALAAARAKIQAGGFSGALDLLMMAGAGPPAESRLVRADLLRAQVAYYTNRGNDASPQLLSAARRLEPIDVGLSRATYLEALSAAMFAGRLAGPGGSSLDVSRALAVAPVASRAATVADLLLLGFATHFTQGYAAGLPPLRAATAAFTDEIAVDEQLRALFLANVAALHAWDDERWQAVATRYARLARQAGSLTELPLALTMSAHLHCFHGELEATASLYGELQAVADAAGTHVTAYSALFYAAMRGTDAEASSLIESATRDATIRGEGVGLAVIDWAEALLSNGLSDYERAVTAAQRIPEFDLGVYNWALPELIEGAARSQQAEVAAAALGRLSEQADAAGTDWARGIEARSRALLAPDESAERLYQQAIEHLGRTRMRADLARAHLLYGEWLRRERRRGEAREELRAAHLMLQEMDMGGFAERARHELLATGEAARKRTGVTDDRQLTPQEAQIARLARDGLSNPEIGARLFISARTVQYHLGKVFSKLDIGSRGELPQALASDLADDPA
jgi:DNA-binding CsgD family transcriptional regulator